MQRTAIYAGSFDPFTIGHKSIVDRGLALFDKIIIGIGYQTGKQQRTTPEERAEAIASLYPAEIRKGRIEVIPYSCLTAQLASEKGAQFLLRGVRSVADYEYERNLADANRLITPDRPLETVILFAEPHLAAVSSSLVRELAHFGHPTDSLVP